MEQAEVNPKTPISVLSVLLLAWAGIGFYLFLTGVGVLVLWLVFWGAGNIVSLPSKNRGHRVLNLGLVLICIGIAAGILSNFR